MKIIVASLALLLAFTAPAFAQSSGGGAAGLPLIILAPLKQLLIRHPDGYVCEYDAEQLYLAGKSSTVLVTSECVEPKICNTPQLGPAPPLPDYCFAQAPVPVEPTPTPTPTPPEPVDCDGPTVGPAPCD